MTEFHVLFTNNLICDFITSLALLISPDLVLDKYEYLIILCIWLNYEHPPSFVDVTEDGVIIETYELFDVESLPFS